MFSAHITAIKPDACCFPVSGQCMDEPCDTSNIEQTDKGFRCAIDVPSVLYKSVYNHVDLHPCLSFKNVGFFSPHYAIISFLKMKYQNASDEDPSRVNE